MAAPSDLTKTGQELVYGLINTENSATLTKGVASATNMTLAAPTALTGDASGKNTSVVVSAIEGEGYTSPDVTIHYNRLDIDTDVLAKLAVGGVSLEDNGYTTITLLVAQLNTQFSLNLQASDIANGATAISGAYPRTATVTIAAGSLAYIGDVAVTITQPDVALNDAITTTTLDGLTGPA